MHPIITTPLAGGHFQRLTPPDKPPPDAICLYLHQGHIAVDAYQHIAWQTIASCPTLHTTPLIALGHWQGVWRYAAHIDEPSDGDYHWQAIRRHVTMFAPGEADLLGTAMALHEWHQHYQYCGICGSKTEFVAGGRRRDCTQGHQHFPRIDPAVIMLVYDQHDRILLGRAKHWPTRMMSVLAGFIDAGETPEDAVRREVFEEVGVHIGTVRYLGAQPWPFPRSLMLGYTAKAETTQLHIDYNELECAAWYHRSTLQQCLQGHNPENIMLSNPASISRHLIDYWMEHPEDF